MSKKYLTVYNLSREKDWVLKNAYDIIETQEINTVWQLEFTIPMNDQDQQHCQPYWYVRYGDDGQLYRFTEQVKTNADKSTITYHCEHVIATLSDDVMFQGPYIKGNNGTYTNDVLDFILEKQTPINGIKNWDLGICEPRRQFEYSWENENLLAALFSVPNCFATPYMWTYDTTSHPWKVNLVEIHEDADPDFYLMARKNILRSEESSSNLEICTRLYGLGEGEGVNQLTIKEAKVKDIIKDSDGIPTNATIDSSSDIKYGNTYIQSSPEKIAEYGIVSRIFVDRRFQSSETLMARMQTLLHELETPSMKREFDIVDLYDLSPDDMYKAEVGRICLLKDDNTKVYITKTVKNWSVPGDMKITIATKPTDISTSIADLADRQRIEQVYSQGASQVYAFNFSGNATDQLPLNGYVYFPEDLKYLNEVKLKIKLDPFRSYSKASSGKNGEINQDTGENGAINQDTGENGAINQDTGEGGKINTETGEGGAQTGETSVASGGGGISLDTSSLTVTVDIDKTGFNSSINDFYTDRQQIAEYLKINEQTGNHRHDNSVSGSTGWMEGSHAHSIKENGDGHRHVKEGEYDTYTGYQTVAENLYIDSNTGSHSHSISGSVSYSGNHSHGIQDSRENGHRHSIDSALLDHWHTFDSDIKGKINVNNSETGMTGFSHSHNFKIKAHTHKIEVKAHTHKIEVQGHKHKIEVGPHFHDIQAGIFTSGSPTQADLFIDGKKAATIATTEAELDITEALTEGGKVPRGRWINISIKPTDPEPNNMAYISVFGNVFAFIQSYTGGNF